MDEDERKNSVPLTDGRIGDGNLTSGPGKQIQLIVEEGLSVMEENLRSAFRTRMITPTMEERNYDSMTKEKVWIVAKIPEENVCFGYAETGYDGRNLKWGLLFLDKLGMGDSGGWYFNLSDLVNDSGYF